MESAYGGYQMVGVDARCISDGFSNTHINNDVFNLATECLEIIEQFVVRHMVTPTDIPMSQCMLFILIGILHIKYLENWFLTPKDPIDAVISMLKNCTLSIIGSRFQWCEERYLFEAQSLRTLGKMSIFDIEFMLRYAFDLNDVNDEQLKNKALAYLDNKTLINQQHYILYCIQQMIKYMHNRHNQNNKINLNFQV